MDNQINIKRRILELYDKLEVQNSACSIQGMREAFGREIKAHDKAIEERELAIMKEFKDVYLTKYSDEGGMFGDELAVFHVRAIKREGYNTDYERMYSISGTRLSFSKLGVNQREMKGDGYVSDMIGEGELRSMTTITKDKYNEYQKKGTDLENSIKEIISDK